MRRMTLVSLLTTACISILPLQAADPITDAVLGGIEHKAQSILDRAKDDANDVVNNAAIRALSIIEAWKKANSELLNQGFDRIDETTKNFFNNMSTDLDRLEKGEEKTAKDIQKITNQWSSTIKDLPFTNKDPEVVDYFPRVFLPIGDEQIPVHIVGPKVSTAESKLTVGDAEQPANRATDNELLSLIKREGLQFDEAKSRLQTMKGHFTWSTSTWWKPSTWGSTASIDREMTFLLLPKRMAKIKVVPQHDTISTETNAYTVAKGGKGRDSTYDQGVPLPPDLDAGGWAFDVDAIVAKPSGFSAVDIGGDHASCGSVLRESLTPKLFTFRIYLGHKTDNWGRKSDSWVNCRLSVPIVKRTTTLQDAVAIEFDMDWTVDKRQVLSDDTKSYFTEVTMFNGRVYQLTEQSKEPFGFIEVERVNDKTLIFHPRPPSDF
ncbi:hypothetical protein NKH49_11545 [Mesorhizobium sp. M1088]|uniref:hypothetical protein n=1 Tax=Mesorhizobium sp. M1088 TaxID=2957056 RepID=UPI00333B64B1